MKAKLLQADDIAGLEKQLIELLQKKEVERYEKVNGSQEPVFDKYKAEVNEIHNVQQYITQIIEPSALNPRQGTQKIIYYLLIIYS